MELLDNIRCIESLKHLVKIKQNKEHPLLSMILMYDIVLPARKSCFDWLTNDLVAPNDVIKCVTHTCIRAAALTGLLKGTVLASKEGRQLVRRYERTVPTSS